MQDFEKLGAFYLGKLYDTAKGGRTDELVMYDSKDLTTHAVIIGMTGSGKTGLGIGLLEEAAIDNVPVIAVDPKGDVANLLLAFAGQSAAEFRPWVNEDEARQKGQDPDAFAAAEAQRWTKGLADWGQDAERVKRLHAAADFALYTPGAATGRPVSVLRSFETPPDAVRKDPTALRERVQSSASALLGLIGLEADPLKSREHMLVSAILADAWTAGRPLDLGGIIAAIQKPPFTKLGVMDLDTFYPAKERFELAVSLNGLLAAPGFGAWMEGEPLDIGALLFGPGGKARVSVFSIAHLGDAERMFFVSLLLSEIVSWMRTQSGTTSLRAVFYMDEIFGYFPPVAAPPSKAPMLTLLKQARAFGLGVVLATQNPVDLDYKGLANTGTWFIGRLQTDRDKERVLAGLEGALSGPSAVPRAELDALLSGLGKRVFLLHDVHAAKPLAFETRWTMSYLRGPLTLEQAARLAHDAQAGAGSAAQTDSGVGAGSGAAGAVTRPSPSTTTTARPVLPPDVKETFVPAKGGAASIAYEPRLYGSAAVRFANTKLGVDVQQRVTLLAPFLDAAVPVDWNEAERVELEPAALDAEPIDGASFGELPAPASQPKNYAKWSKDFARTVQDAHALTLWSAPAQGLVSDVDETEAAFRGRLGLKLRETRDTEVEALRAKYASKLTTLEERLRRAQAAQDVQAGQARQKQLETAVSVGVGLLGALFGGGRRSAVGRVGTAVRSAGRAVQEQQDVSRAAETVAAVQAQLDELNGKLQAEIDAVTGVDASSLALEEVKIRPKVSDVRVELVTLTWLPR